MERDSLLPLLVISIIGIGTHLLPHPWGFTTVGAISMLAAVYLPRAAAGIPVILTVLVADLFIGGYAALSMAIVYTAHILATLAAYSFCRPTRVAGFAAGAVVNAAVFYLTSNLAPMSSGFYPPTSAGLAACYIAALPFLAKGILANLVFGGLILAGIEVQRFFAGSKATA